MFFTPTKTLRLSDIITYKNTSFFPSAISATVIVFCFNLPYKEHRRMCQVLTLVMLRFNEFNLTFGVIFNHNTRSSLNECINICSLYYNCSRCFGCTEPYKRSFTLTKLNFMQNHSWLNWNIYSGFLNYIFRQI